MRPTTPDPGCTMFRSSSRTTVSGPMRTVGRPGFSSPPRIVTRPPLAPAPAARPGAGRGDGTLLGDIPIAGHHRADLAMAHAARPGQPSSLPPCRLLAHGGGTPGIEHGDVRVARLPEVGVGGPARQCLFVPD